ncbi:zinc finger BED domain-containing protein 5 [Bactrocera oleae]|uniref:zinc finger BED domain-containing protein 5 n=1 Tax=Bactrocera oleae TaxID=104688 RepID=UPI00387E4119
MERWLKGVKRVAITSSNNAECSKAVRAKNIAITDPEDDASTSSLTVSKTKIRKYDESYISFGFVDSNGSPLCMLCSKLLPNSSMAPAKLRRHLETVHPESKDKNKEFFVRKKYQLLESQKNMMHVTQTINEKATEASYLVSYRIAQAVEAHTSAENLIKPCVLDITKCMLDEKSAKHLSTVPLSNDTVSRRIHDLANYVKQELVTRLQNTRFALQMDESTDVAGLATLLVITSASSPGMDGSDPAASSKPSQGNYASVTANIATDLPADPIEYIVDPQPTGPCKGNSTYSDQL